MKKIEEPAMNNEDMYYFILPSFGLKFGGLTGTVLKKTRFLSEAGYKCTVLTMTYSKDFYAIKRAQRKNGKLGKSVELLNAFYFFAGESEDEPRKQKRNKLKIRSKTVEYSEKRNAYRVYKKGVLKESWTYDKKDRLSFINYYEENRKKYKRIIFDKKGYLTRSEYLSSQNDDVTTRMYHRMDGSCYLSYWYSDEGKVSRIVWFNKDGSVKKVFKSESMMYKYYLDELVRDDYSQFFVSEKRWYDEAVINMESRDNVYKIMSHHGHMYPYIPKSFASMDKIDATVVLTEWYKKDIEAKYKNSSNLTVIPNSFDGPDSMPDFDNRNTNRVISTSRYVEIKQVDHMIRAFEQAIKKVPGATLDLYGKGREMPKLKELIKELNLSESVKLRGYSSDVGEEYSSAAISLQTSRSEGFSLSTLESLSYGCPVVSYDIRYGPSDVIVDGKNGFLVEKDNISDLANKIVKCIEDKKQLEKMSKNAYESAKKFNDNDWIKAWTSLLESVKSN